MYAIRCGELWLTIDVYVYTDGRHETYICWGQKFERMTFKDKNVAHTVLDSAPSAPNLGKKVLVRVR